MKWTHKRSSLRKCESVAQARHTRAEVAAGTPHAPRAEMGVSQSFQSVRSYGRLLVNLRYPRTAEARAHPFNQERFTLLLQTLKKVNHAHTGSGMVTLSIMKFCMAPRHLLHTVGIPRTRHHLECLWL